MALSIHFLFAEENESAFEHRALANDVEMIWFGVISTSQLE